MGYRDLPHYTQKIIEFTVANRFLNYRIHDIDNNTKLDGLEILHALQHTLHEDGEEMQSEQDLSWIVGMFE